MLCDELWETIAEPETVRCDPVEPDLFSWADVPCFQQVETFLCFACVERRLGRQLTQEDLNTSMWNAGWIADRRRGGRVAARGPASIGGRTRSTPGGGHRGAFQHCRHIRSQSSDWENPYRLQHWLRPS